MRPGHSLPSFLGPVFLQRGLSDQNSKFSESQGASGQPAHCGREKGGGVSGHTLTLREQKPAEGLSNITELSGKGALLCRNP